MSVFLSTGLIDACFKLFQVQGLTDEQFPGFVITIFGFAYIAAGLHHALLPDRVINRVSIGSGILLGLANLGTVYFVLKALVQPGWKSSVVFPLNNFGTVLVSTLTAIFLFGEHPETTTKLSLCCATLSIALLYAASQRTRHSMPGISTQYNILDSHTTAVVPPNFLDIKALFQTMALPMNSY